MSLKELYGKYKDIIPYAVFGVLTTLVNTAVYWAAAHPFGADVMPSAVAAWFISVAFAYVTNRKWVFHSAAHTLRLIFREAVSFFACRFVTGIADIAVMYIFAERLHFNDVIIKLAANIAVIILNYIASKLIIFKKGG